jgi:hypothetical protein
MIIRGTNISRNSEAEAELATMAAQHQGRMVKSKTQNRAH